MSVRKKEVEAIFTVAYPKFGEVDVLAKAWHIVDSKYGADADGNRGRRDEYTEEYRIDSVKTQDGVEIISQLDPDDIDYLLEIASTAYYETSDGYDQDECREWDEDAARERKAELKKELARESE